MHKTSSKAVLRCRCGRVNGTVANASPRTVNRVICYCDDCQTFARFLGRPDLLDRAGGSDIIQIAASRMKIDAGTASIRGIRLSLGGSSRWYAACCNTPIGNVADKNMPGIGVHSAGFRSPEQDVDALFGKPIGTIRGEYATASMPRGARGVPFRVLLRAVPKVLAWKILGKGWPHPFLSRSTKEHLFPIETLGAVISQS